MKNLSVVIIAIGLSLVGCSQEEVDPIASVATSTSETNGTVSKSNSETRMESLNLKEANEIAIFNKAVNGATKEPGIVNMANPHYQFNIDGESYFLWIDEISGTIMNKKDTNTIYSLSITSVQEINEFINKE